MTELAIRLVFSLAIVLGLLMMCARLAGRRFKGTREAMVQVVHRQPIGRHASVSVVNVSGRLLVLGTTDQEVRLLAELGSDDELDPDQLDDPDGDRDERDGDAPADLDEPVDHDDAPTEPTTAPTEQPAAAALDVRETDPVLAALGGEAAELVAAQPTGRHAYTGRHAVRPPGKHADRSVPVDGELPSHVPTHAAVPVPAPVEAPVEVTVEVPVAPADPVITLPVTLPVELPVAEPVALPVRLPVPAAAASEPKLDIAGEPLASPASVAKALRALEALDRLQGRTTPRVVAPAPALVEVPAALLLAEEAAPAADEPVLDEPAAEVDETVADTEAAPARRRSRRAAARRARVQAPAADDSPLAGSVLSTKTWRQAWGAVSGKAS